MKLTRLLLTLAGVFCMLAAFSQTDLSSGSLRNVKVDALSDTDIQTYYGKAVTAGATEEQVYQVVQQRGLPAEEINKLRQRIGLLKSNPSKRTLGAATDIFYLHKQ